MSTSLARISELEQELAKITDLRDARKALALAQGLMTAARKEYRASEKVSEVREDRDRAYETAIKAGELRLLAEARLGELIRQEQAAGRLAIGKNNLKQYRNDTDVISVKHLRDYGLSLKDSERAQKVAEHKDLIPLVVIKARETGDLPTRKLLEQIALKKLWEEKMKKIPPLPEKQFSVIYADPPWRYEFSQSEARSIEAHYPTMSLEEICALPIPATKDAVLFLWAPPPKLKEAMQVIDAWGFKYRASMVWVKVEVREERSGLLAVRPQIGMGYYARETHELLLIARKGDIALPNPDNRFSSVILAPRTEHSRKPEVVYELIERMYPNFSKIELFARRKRPGWTSWGVEIA